MTVLNPVVNSEYCCVSLFLDVHHLLSHFFPTRTYSFKLIQSMNSSIVSIILPDWTCNDIDYQIFDFSRFIRVISIEIGNDCFGSVQTFKIDGLNRLKSIKIGNNSFTQNKNSYGNDPSKSFHILNCESLKSIEIGEYSFNDYGGEFELKNLSQLQSIQMGSYNFYNNSFVIRGIDMILNIVMNRSSKSSIHYIG